VGIAHTTVGGCVRYLFVTVDGGGNLYPELALAGRLAGRGHDVRFLGNRSQRTVIERAGHGFAPYRWAPDIDATASETSRFKDWATDPGTAFAALCDHLWFGPASLFAADVTTELGRHRADALAIDYFLYGALADPALGNHARRHAASLQAEIAQDRAVTEMEALTSR
jgi:hypothetical protein